MYLSVIYQCLLSLSVLQLQVSYSKTGRRLQLRVRWAVSAGQRVAYDYYGCVLEVDLYLVSFFCAVNCYIQMMVIQQCQFSAGLISTEDTQ